MARSAAIAMLGLAASPASAFFLMPCWPITTQRLDPIVNPGEISTHVHQIAGGNGFAPMMHYNDTQSADCTTCFVSKDKSNYWIPALYFQHTDGSFERVEQVGSASMYYFNEKSRLGPGEVMESFPEGLRILAGDPAKRSGGQDFADQAINYKCLDYSGTPTDSKGFPDHNCANGVRAEVTFPSCWDGKNLDSDDHKSHMAYPVTTFESGSCPSSHPHHMVTLKVEFIFNTNKFAGQWSGKNPFVWSSGDPTGFGLHADYMMGWDYDVLESAVDQCFDINGVLANCPPFQSYLPASTQYVNPNTCKLDDMVDEDVGGQVETLPGCNTVFAGPGKAIPGKNCNDDGAKLLGKWANVAANAVGDIVDGLTGGKASSSGAGAFYKAVSTTPAVAATTTVATSATTPVTTPAAIPTTTPAADYVATVTEYLTETAYTVDEAVATVTANDWTVYKRNIGDHAHRHQHRHARHAGGH